MSRYANPVSQIEDDDGKPIVGAKKYFFETGTSTLKTVYSDAALSLPIDNPVLSDSGGRFPSIFIDGIYREVQHDDKGVQLWDEDPVGELPSGQAQLWSVSTTYNTPEIVYASDDEYYRSLTDSNVGNNPTTSPAAWELVKFTQVWNTNVTYALNQHIYGSDGDLYVSLEASNFGNDPTGAGGKWEYVSVDNGWADIASAATTDLGAAKGHSGNITGTTTITSFGTIKEGTRKTATFTGSLTLTYNATSLILLGNANIITQAGDVAEFISLGSGNWICSNYENHYAASGYVSGVTEYLEADVGADVTGFNVAPAIGAAWESVGPTGSSATNIWPDLDIIPSGAKWINVKMENEASDSAGSASGQTVYSRVTGSSTGVANGLIISRIYSSAAGVADMIIFSTDSARIPIDSSGRFDLYRTTFFGDTFTFTMYLVGWGV